MRRLLPAALIVLVALNAFPAHAAPAADEGAFRRLWERTDAPVASGQAKRTWYWGAAPLETLDEDYAEGVGGKRRVQYWDKGRMEISNPNDDPSDPWYVTSGLLSIELIGGRVQTGDRTFERVPAAEIPIAGDPDPETNPDAPTYRDFYLYTSVLLDTRLQPVSNDPIGPGNADSAAPPRFGDLAAERVNANGRIEKVPELAASVPGTRLVYYDGVLSHNIPKVFWDFVQQTGKVQVNGALRQDLLMDWQYMLGHPASEPYWVKTEIGGVAQDILVQVYERRVLTYNPRNPAGWQVEMGNVGQHYRQWRYSRVGRAPQAPTQRPANTNASVSPEQGPGGTRFEVTLRGFEPGETVSVWLTLPNQAVEGAPEQGQANADGVATLFNTAPIRVNTNSTSPPGIWAVTGQGASSGRTAIAYFTVTSP
jgi:hypothetical protein